jgi:multidrug transporter EmrE-like cation transporter
VSSAEWSTWLLAACAAACNAVAQLLMKKAHITRALDWQQWVAVYPLAALAIYAVSFVLTALVFARLPLSLASPLMAGAIFVLVSVFSVALLGENLGGVRVAGIACVLAGIALLSRSA